MNGFDMQQSKHQNYRVWYTSR